MDQKEDMTTEIKVNSPEDTAPGSQLTIVGPNNQNPNPVYMNENGGATSTQSLKEKVKIASKKIWNVK